MLIDHITLNGTSLVNFRQFLTNFTTYPLIIPNNYQRDYKWAIPLNKGQCTALEIFLEDFKKGLDLGKNFVLGNIVCIACDANKTVHHLADGQQRITTIFLVLLEILKRYPNYMCTKLFKTLFMDDDKLFLQQSNEDWDEIFRETLLSEADDPLLNISLAQEIINTFIDSCEDFNLDLWRDYLLNNVKFNLQWIPLECETDYFIDVNTKGVTLNNVDTLKLTILNKDHISQDKGEHLWGKFILEINKFRLNPLSAKLGNLEEGILIHTLYFLQIIPELRRSYLKKLVASKEFNTEIVLNKAIEYLQYLNSSKDIWLNILIYLKNANMIAMYYKCLTLGMSNKNSFKRVCKHVLSYIISSQADVQTLSRNITEPGEFKISIDDPRYKYGPGKTNLKFVLFCIEAFLREGSLENNLLFLIQSAKEATLEHIQSQQFGGSDGLGNLTLLSKADNSKLNNLQEKLQIYKNSNYLITRCFSVDYTPNSDVLRRLRSMYLPSVTSQELDIFGEEATIRRFNNINSLMNEILKES